jgi:glutamyl-Q tRNA(Asp) synthetase
MYTGRFAPSPTGPLHMGSLVAAAASWLDARAAGGRWLVRLEDLDQPRCVPGASDDILRTLERLGLTWDGEVVYQSRRLALYRAALNRLRAHTYWCGCSRREVADSSLGLAADGAPIYPGTCRAGISATARALRVRVPGEELCFTDRLLGRQCQELARAVGDFVLQRVDGAFAYQLAVVVDDSEQGVTDVVRGADLLDSTVRQVHLQRLLDLPTPRYLHVPVVLTASGEKASKQTGAEAVRPSFAALQTALRFLGQPAAESLEQALGQWEPALIPRQRALALPA